MHLRLVTLNVCNTEGEPERLAAINRELGRLDPDLVAFQEVVQTADVKFLDTLLDGLDLHATHQASSSTSKLARTAEDGRSGSLAEGRGMAGATGGGGLGWGCLKHRPKRDKSHAHKLAELGSVHMV